MTREQLKALWEDVRGTLNEKQRRQYAASLAKAWGYGGATVVHQVTGISLNTITRGKRELEQREQEQEQEQPLESSRIRAAGGGRKSTEEKYPNIRDHIQQIVDGSTYGNPEKILFWINMSLRKIARKLQEQYGEKVSPGTVRRILKNMGYSKQANKKMLQVGEPHPDRNAQFEYINDMAKEFIAAGEPVISVDTKKKELIGNFRNPGQEYRRKKDPHKSLDHDFPIEGLSKIAPYGLLCLNNNIGFVNVGTSHDTSDFAVESISRWWFSVGKHTFPNATKLLITCDCGGSNGYRTRLWKYNLSQFAQSIGLDIYVCHFPPGTSKWNKVEHRLFCYISKNWQGKPLISVEAAVSLIGSTTTTTGLKVICQRDDTVYELARTVSDADFAAIPIERISPREAWNYVLLSQVIV